jgi:hypothetical protein
MEDHMKYMLLIYDDETAWPEFSEAERQQFMGEYNAVHSTDPVGRTVCGQFSVAPDFGGDQRPRMPRQTARH